MSYDWMGSQLLLLSELLYHPVNDKQLIAMQIILIHNRVEWLLSGGSTIPFPPYRIGLPRWLKGEESACQCRRCGFHPWVRKIPWRRKWQPTPVFLSGKSPWTGGPGGLRSIGWQKVEHDLATRQQQHRISHFCIYLLVPFSTSYCLDVCGCL